MRADAPCSSLREAPGAIGSCPRNQAGEVALHGITYLLGVCAPTEQLWGTAFPHTTSRLHRTSRRSLSTELRTAFDEPILTLENSGDKKTKGAALVF